MKLVNKNRISFVMLLTLGCLVGCGEKATTVTGTATYNGEKIKRGSISFRPADGSGQSFAAKIVDGRYEATDRVTPGPKTVVVTGFREVNFYASSEESYKKAAEASKAGQAEVAESTDYIADDAEGNNKQVEIVPGDQTLDFSITGVPLTK